MSKELSILICSLERRAKYLERLLAVLTLQVIDNVEVLVETDNGKFSVGQKRNLLIDKAQGKYVAYIDDDDLVEPIYIEKILEAIKTEPDVVGIHLLHFENNVLSGLTYHSLKYKHWWHEKNEENPKLINYYRNPNHINPVKKELAAQIKFPGLNRDEDKDYSRRLLPLLKTEVYIEEPIYRYLNRNPKEV